MDQKNNFSLALKKGTSMEKGLRTGDNSIKREASLWSLNSLIDNNAKMA